MSASSSAPLAADVQLVVGAGEDVRVERATAGSRPDADLRTLMRERFAGLGPEARARVMSSLLEPSDALDSSIDPHGVSESLALVRDALRDPHPRIGPAAGPHALAIDGLVRIDERRLFAHGWVHDEQAPVTRLSAVSPEGARAELLGQMARVPRPDLEELFSLDGSEELGFVCAFELESPSRLDRGWLFELENAAGSLVELEGPVPTDDPLAARDAIVSTLDKDRAPGGPVAEHVLPAVARLQERLAASVEVARVEQFGAAPEDPEVSIIVPLYKRVDLLQHQLAQFASDPELAEAELIYVLDSPELAAPTLAESARLFELYRVPFRLAILSRNGGFAVANNRGASLATGRLLLLLNSDVLPEAPGWLSRLAELYDATPGVGALGPKLLFEDDTLQHAGLYFRRGAPWSAWENAHFFKGLHTDLPAANVARAVPAVTAACLMIARSLYQELGGLRSVYIQGDYEDSDLCLRLDEAGYESWYRPEVTLYHLEGRSYSTATRQGNARYNTWLQTSLWGERIARLMAEESMA